MRRGRDSRPSTDPVSVEARLVGYIRRGRRLRPSTDPVSVEARLVGYIRRGRRLRPSTDPVSVEARLVGYAAWRRLEAKAGSRNSTDAESVEIACRADAFV